jgi:hypothetical protein
VESCHSYGTPPKEKNKKQYFGPLYEIQGDFLMRPLVNLGTMKKSLPNINSCGKYVVILFGFKFHVFLL